MQVVFGCVHNKLSHYVRARIAKHSQNIGNVADLVLVLFFSLDIGFKSLLGYLVHEVLDTEVPVIDVHVGVRVRNPQFVLGNVRNRSVNIHYFTDIFLSTELFFGGIVHFVIRGEPAARDIPQISAGRELARVRALKLVVVRVVDYPGLDF